MFEPTDNPFAVGDTVTVTSRLGGRRAAPRRPRHAHPLTCALPGAGRGPPLSVAVEDMELGHDATLAKARAA